MVKAKRIMMIDDNPDHLLLAKRILEQNGYMVETLQDCSQLLRRVRLYRPKLIFMDHHMPVMDGIAATRLLKSNARYNRIPVVYFSSEDNISALAESAGADDWLRKPFRLEDLIQKAGDHLSRV
ncbi:MAG TPA: response regulator [Puia sp.]|nr:response regulator [Puia sp.]